MIIEVSSEEYKQLFQKDPHPFVSWHFTEENKFKADRIVYLVDESGQSRIGLIAGVRDNMIKSPFSAPFGGFHFKKETVYTSEIDSFLVMLEEYLNRNSFDGFQIILPPDIYHGTFNAKIINALMRNSFQHHIPEITNWVDLDAFHGTFNLKNSREYLRQAVRNKLTCKLVSEENEQKEVYELIKANRARFGRSIYMSYEDLKKMESLWPVDYFGVYHATELIASAIFYRFHSEICYAVFWGDSEDGRPLRAMDYLSHHLWMHYKSEKFTYIDLGISTESGVPNHGLLRFKESHNSTSSLRHRFSWHPGT